MVGGWQDKYTDDIGMPHDDVRRLVNSIIFMEKHLPPVFAETEHERLNLVFFAREFINADKVGPSGPAEVRPPQHTVFIPGVNDDDDDDDESESV